VYVRVCVCVRLRLRLFVLHGGHQRDEAAAAAAAKRTQLAKDAKARGRARPPPRPMVPATAGWLARVAAWAVQAVHVTLANAHVRVEDDTLVGALPLVCMPVCVPVSLSPSPSLCGMRVYVCPCAHASLSLSLSLCVYMPDLTMGSGGVQAPMAMGVLLKALSVRADDGATVAHLPALADTPSRRGLVCEARDRPSPLLRVRVCVCVCAHRHPLTHSHTHALTRAHTHVLSISTAGAAGGTGGVLGRRPVHRNGHGRRAPRSCGMCTCVCACVYACVCRSLLACM
jgi:hypothetical protein